MEFYSIDHETGSYVADCGQAIQDSVKSIVQALGSTLKVLAARQGDPESYSQAMLTVYEVASTLV